MSIILESMKSDRDVVSPASVESELMVTEILQDHNNKCNNLRSSGKRKRDTDGEELIPRKLPSLANNNNDVAFVLDESNDNDGQDVSSNK